MAKTKTSRQALLALFVGMYQLANCPPSPAFDFDDPAARAQIGAPQASFAPRETPAQTSHVPAINQRRAPTGLSPRLISILRTLNRPGWSDLGTTIYGFDNGQFKVLNRVAGHSDANSQTTSNEQPLPSLNTGDSSILGEFGCQFLIQKVLQRGNRFVSIYMYEFADSDGANAGYDLKRRGSTTVKRRGDGSSEDAENISFWQDRYLFIISGSSEDDDESKENITKLADMIAGAIPEHAQPPAVLSSLPMMDRVKGSEKVVMGLLSASKYFSAPELPSLALDKAHAAAVADYQVFQPARERMKLLYIDYGNTEIAQAAYNAFVTRLEELHDAESNLPGPDARVLFRINKTFLLCQLKPNGKLVLISGARKSKSPALLASQIIER